MNWIAALSGIPAVLSGVTAGLLVVFEQRQTRIWLMAVIYVWVAWLVALEMDLLLAIVKLVAGWTACAILAFGPQRRITTLTSGMLPRGVIFRVIAVLLVSTAAVGLGRNPLLELSIVPAAMMTGGLQMAILGMLQIGLARDAVGASIGNLVLISGFEVVYTSLEPSLAIMALFACVHIAIATAIAILGLWATTEEEDV